MAQGFVPRQMDFYIQGKRKFGVPLPTSYRTARNGSFIEGVHAAWPIRHGLPDDAKTRQSASSWAKWEDGGLPMETLPNTPSRGYRLAGAEPRGNGGRAWKVLTPQGWLVDMREDQIMPVLLSKGIGPGPFAELDAEFVWVAVGSQVMLADTANRWFHENVETAAERTVAKTKRKRGRKASELRLGGIYFNHNTFSRVMYLGRVRHDGRLLYATISSHRNDAFLSREELWRGMPKIRFVTSPPSGDLTGTGYLGMDLRSACYSTAKLDFIPHHQVEWPAGTEWSHA